MGIINNNNVYAKGRIMDLDNITDIELLRNLVKRNMVQMKKDCRATDGTDFIFKKGLWYFVDQDQYDVTMYTEDFSSMACLTYDEAEEYLVTVES